MSALLAAHHQVAQLDRLRTTLAALPPLTASSATRELLKRAELSLQADAVRLRHDLGVALGLAPWQAAALHALADAHAAHPGEAWVSRPAGVTRDTLATLSALGLVERGLGILWALTPLGGEAADFLPREAPR